MQEVQEKKWVDDADWVSAKKEIRKLGIRVNVSLNSCGLGCVGCADATFGEDEPALFATAARFNSDYGGYIHHQNLSAHQYYQVFEVLRKRKVRYEWNQPYHCIKVDFGGYYEEVKNG